MGFNIWGRGLAQAGKPEGFAVPCLLPTSKDLRFISRMSVSDVADPGSGSYRSHGRGRLLDHEMQLGPGTL